MELLIRAGADVKAKNRLGITPLYLAAMNGNGAVIRALLDAGANANQVEDTGETSSRTPVTYRWFWIAACALGLAVAASDARLAAAGGQRPEATQPLSMHTPTGAPDNFEDHIKMLFDLQLLAFRAEITRISTLMLAHELSNAVFPATNIRDGFHNLSHHSNSRANMDRFAELNNYHHGVFAYFLEKLKATPDGDGSLLDHSLVLHGSGMSDGNQHNHTPLPMLLVGGASGALKGGRHIKLSKLTTHSNLLLTVLHKAGVRAEKIGDSTGPIEEI